MARKKGSKNINSKLEGQILTVKAANPDWSANQVMRCLKQNSNGNSFMPKLRTIQKILSEGRQKLDEIAATGLDKPWHIGMISTMQLTTKFPELTSEAIQVITEVQKWSEKEGIERVHDKAAIPTRYGITLRQALWIARLYRAVKKHMGNDSHEIWRVAWAYSSYQLMCELSGTDFDTWEFDRALRNASKMKGNREFVLLIWNIFGASTDEHEYAFQAQFKQHMASQRIKPRKLRSMEQIAEDAKQRLAESEAKIKAGGE